MCFFENERMTVGSSKAPHFLAGHVVGHVVGRGDPNHEYVKGLRLYGPFPGQDFLLRGDPKKRKQGNAMIEWDDRDMKRMGVILDSELRNVLENNDVFVENILRAYKQ